MCIRVVCIIIAISHVLNRLMMLVLVQNVGTSMTAPERTQKSDRPKPNDGRWSEQGIVADDRCFVNSVQRGRHVPPTLEEWGRERR